MLMLLMISLFAELIILFLISRSILKIVEAKELDSTKYIVYTILLWFGLQAIFYVAGLLLFKFIPLAFLSSVIGASLGGLIAYRIAKTTRQAWSKYEEVE